MNELVEPQPEPAVAVQSAHARVRAVLRRGWVRLWLDERAAYLSQASSHADLQRRIRHREECKRKVYGWFY